MKKQTNVNFAKMNKGQLHELTTTVKEIATKDIVPDTSFTLVDLRNIQRRSNSITNSRKPSAFH